jgi:hypothetical protein
MDIHYYKSHIKRHGIFKTVFRVFSKSVNKLFTLKLLYLIKDEYLYVYNVYTHPDYRGQRLLALGVATALRELSELCYNSFISAVDFDDFSSIKSMYRMGWKKVGIVFFIKIFKKHTVFPIGKHKHPGFEVSGIKRQLLKKKVP